MFLKSCFEKLLLKTNGWFLPFFVFFLQLFFLALFSTLFAVFLLPTTT